jgi:hypothetical protein
MEVAHVFFFKSKMDKVKVWGIVEAEIIQIGILKRHNPKIATNE